MICYRDMTFCNAPNCTCPEWRRLTPAVIDAALKWWGSVGAPIAVGHLCKPKETA